MNARIQVGCLEDVLTFDIDVDPDELHTIRRFADQFNQARDAKDDFFAGPQIIVVNT